MLQGLAKVILKAGGWTMVGGLIKVPKAVVLAAPHTSNWDAFWAIVYLVASGNKVRIFAKHSLFWFPLGNLLRAFGCLPLNRSKARSVVRQAVDTFKSEDSFYLGLAPEGTRSLATGWKSGFYRIASDAGVPVCFGFLDYGKKRLGIVPGLELTGDKEADMNVCAEFYADIEGRVPENKSPVQLQKRRPKKNSTD
ncbi:MAG: 1-acyl-sn-glycerol-3-phosphate acyltransferase [Gammaproteobacteria bacterium]